MPANVAEAKQWVANWRSKSIKAAAYGKPADDKGTTVPAPAAAAAPAIEQPPAKEWIAVSRGEIEDVLGGATLWTMYRHRLQLV